MKIIKLLFLLLTVHSAHAQIQTIWETNHPVGGDSLEVHFYKQDSAGNHYAGGAIGMTFFVSKFDSNGQHQWTVSDNRLLNRSPHVNFDNEPIAKSLVSDIAFESDKIYLSGTKQYQSQWVNRGKSGWNFVLKLNTNGDSITFINVLKEDVPLSSLWSEAGHKPLMQFNDNQLYFFTSLPNLMNPPLGVENINVFKYDENLNLLKYKMFEGVVSASRDTVKSVQFFDNKFIIHSMSLYWPRLLACDTSLSLIWNTHFRTNPSPNHTTLPFIISDSNIFTYPTTRDTSRKNPPIYYNKFAGHIRIYNLSGDLLDSIILFQTLTSDDNITDAIINEENNYVTGLSIDSGNKKVFITKLNKKLQKVQNILLGEKPTGRVKLESDGCRLYLSFIDSLITGKVLMLFRIDENLNILSEERYYNGNDLISSLLVANKQISLLSTGKSTLTDTLSLKYLSDTIKISEPVSFTSTAINSRSIELGWQLLNGLSDSLEILKSINGIDWQYLQTLVSSDTVFTDSNLIPSTKYFYTIRTKWRNEYSCNELLVSDSTPLNVGINYSYNNPFLIYPNPASDNVQIIGKENINEIELATVTGKPIRYYYQKSNISIKDVPSGLYIITINKIHTFKIMKL